MIVVRCFFTLLHMNILCFLNVAVEALVLVTASLNPYSKICLTCNRLFSIYDHQFKKYIGVCFILVAVFLLQCFFRR